MVVLAHPLFVWGVSFAAIRSWSKIPKDVCFFCLFVNFVHVNFCDVALILIYHPQANSFHA